MCNSPSPLFPLELSITVQSQVSLCAQYQITANRRMPARAGETNLAMAKAATKPSGTPYMVAYSLPSSIERRPIQTVAIMNIARMKLTRLANPPE